MSEQGANAGPGPGPEPYLNAAAGGLGVALGMLALAAAAAAAERRRLAGAAAPGGYVSTLEHELDDNRAERDALVDELGKTRELAEEHERERRRVERQNLALAAEVVRARHAGFRAPAPDPLLDELDEPDDGGELAHEPDELDEGDGAP